MTAPSETVWQWAGLCLEQQGSTAWGKHHDVQWLLTLTPEFCLLSTFILLPVAPWALGSPFPASAALLLLLLGFALCLDSACLAHLRCKHMASNRAYCFLLASNTNHSSVSRSLHRSELPPLTLPKLWRSSSSGIYTQTPRICDVVLHCNMQQTHYFKRPVKVANSYFLFPQRKWNLTFQDLILNVVSPKSRYLSHCTWLICKLLFPLSSLQHLDIESLKPKTPPTPGTPSYRTGNLHSILSATHLPQKLRNKD